MESSRIQELLDTPIHALSLQFMLSDVIDMLEVSEQSLIERYEFELDKLTLENHDEEYQLHLINGLEYRFKISLPLRLRYSAIIGICTSLEWHICDSSGSSKLPLVKRLRKVCNQEGIDADSLLTRLEVLVYIRNCIAHASGLLASYKYSAELLENIKNIDGVEITEETLFGKQLSVTKEYITEISDDLTELLVKISKSRRSKT